MDGASRQDDANDARGLPPDDDTWPDAPIAFGDAEVDATQKTSTPPGFSDPELDRSLELEAAIEPRLLERLDLGAAPRHFYSGPAPGHAHTGFRRAIAWFGFRSFWGHLRRFAASAIATEDVDTRDWMEPTPPTGLVSKVARTLGAEKLGATLVDCLDRDIVIDFVSDSGDDAELAERFARMLFRPYRFVDPDDPTKILDLPRGDILLHGGDVAYPVANVGEIHDRLIVPWNRGMRAVSADRTQRVLLGVPSNHDWYDGLDGFARMFRERHFAEEPAAQEELLDVRWYGRAITYLNQFLAGETVEKQKALVLRGYRPLQRSSYFVLPLTPSLHLHGVDRQLRRVDYRQRRFFQEWVKAHPEATRLVILPDPVFPFGHPSRSGLQMLRALKLSPEYEPHLCFAGDIHHYRRETIGKSVHVTCGGAGAFLHPTPIAEHACVPCDVEWPNRAQSKALLGKVPWHVASGRSGLIAHAVLFAFFAPSIGLGASAFGREGLFSGSLAAGLLSAAVMWLFGGIRNERWKEVALLAAISGTVMGLIPSGAVLLFEGLAASHGGASTWVFGVLALGTALLAGGFLFGAYLALLTLLGLEHTQAYTALAHHGFRHFVRMRVRRDGSAVDVFVIGQEDLFDPAGRPGIVDAFTFRPRAAEEGTARRNSLAPAPGGMRESISRRAPPERGRQASPSRRSDP